MSGRIASLGAVQIFDSRGTPTLSVTLTTDDGIAATASVPSGASTGAHEAVELRDGDPARFAGKGVTKAIGHIEGEIGARLRGRDVTDQTEAASQIE